MTTSKKHISTFMLIFANLIPIFGVVFLQWDVKPIILLYWAENVITGFYNILRILFLKLEKPIYHIQKLFSILFFSIHFGGFCGVHGFFLLSFFKLGGSESFFPETTWFAHLAFIQILYLVIKELFENMPPQMIWALSGLFISHGISFVQNYIFGGEYKKLTIRKLMHRPYQRIAILHITIIFGGFFVFAVGSSLGILVMLIGIKICVDIYLHNKSHKLNAKQGH